jgi:hypothetical protein
MLECPYIELASSLGCQATKWTLRPASSSPTLDIPVANLVSATVTFSFLNPYGAVYRVYFRHVLIRGLLNSREQIH